MAANLRQLLRMYALYARIDWHFLMRDKRIGLTCAVSDLICMMASISGIALLAIRFGGIGGLTADEILWMLGFFTFADGFTYMMFSNYNVLNISRRIGRGQIDHMLIQPVPLWMQLMTEGFAPFSCASGVWAGIALLAVSTARLGIAVTPDWLLMLFLYTLARTGVAMGISYITGSAAFYRPVACEELSSLALDALNAAGKYPFAGLSLWLQGVFTVALPVGLMAYLPGMILLHKIDAAIVCVWPFAAAAGFLSLGGLIFRKGLRHYAEYGCPRYKEMGHRC